MSVKTEMLRPILAGAGALATALLAATAAAQQAAPVRVVQLERVVVQDTRAFTGSVTAERVSALSPRIEGVVTEIAVDAGDRVEAGEVILRLDDRLARLEQARVQAAVSEGRARLAEAQRVAREAEVLVEKRTLPATQAEAAKAGATISTETLARLEAEAALQAERLRRHRLPAPFAGVITARHVDPGEWVQPTSAVVELVALDSLRFDVRPPQEVYPLLREGDAVTVLLDALPGKESQGHVAARVPVADAGTRSFLLRVVLDEAPDGVIPGMSGRARVQLARGAAAWSVPRDAIVRYPDGTRSVWIVEERDGGLRAAARRVDIVESSGDAVEVLGGLDGGERVIVRGNEGLRDGQPVRIVAEPGT